MIRYVLLYRSRCVGPETNMRARFSSTAESSSRDRGFRIQLERFKVAERATADLSRE
jgi:hypothetical protein